MPTGPLTFQTLKFHSFYSCLLECSLFTISRLLAASALLDPVNNVVFM